MEENGDVNQAERCSLRLAEQTAITVDLPQAAALVREMHRPVHRRFGAPPGCPLP
jgi:hypothetical protein